MRGPAVLQGRAFPLEIANPLISTPCQSACAQILTHGAYSAQAADVWAAGALLFALVSGGFAFLRADEEDLDRAGRMAVMTPRIIAGAFRPLPPEVCSCEGSLLTPCSDSSAGSSSATH